MAHKGEGISSTRRPIVALGADGYGETLYATPQPDGGWLFDVDVPNFPYADPIIGDDLIVTAPKNLDRYTPTSSLLDALHRWFTGNGWVRLFPVEIDPEFRGEVWRLWQEEVENLREGGMTVSERREGRWREACGML